MIPALLVHRLDVRRQVALRPKGDALAVGTHVVAPLQVHHIDVRRQAALVPEGDAGAAGVYSPYAYP